MAKISRQAGSTSHVLEIFAQDTTKTDGSGLTGLAYNTAGLTCYYKRNRGTAATAVTLADITTLGTYVSGGFKEISASNMPGAYEFHPPDAAMASGSGSVLIYLKGAANMAPVLIEIELTATNNQDGQQGGIAALPASGTLAVNPTLNATQAFNNTGQTNNVPADIQTIKTQSVTAAAGVTFPASIGTSTYAGGAVASVTGAVGSVTAPVTVGTNNDKTGYSGTATNLPAAYPVDFTTALPGSPTAGTVGEALKFLDTRLDAAITSRMATFSLPTNFASLAITGGGAVTAGTVSDKTGYSLAVAPPTSAAIVAAVWDEVQSGHTVVGSFGAYLNAAITSRMATFVYTAPLDAAGVRGAVGLASANLDSQLSGIDAKTTNLPDDPASASQIPAAFTDATFESDGVFATEALANAPGGGGGGTPQTGDLYALIEPLIDSGAFTTDSLVNVPRDGYALSTGGVDAVAAAVVDGLPAASDPLATDVVLGGYAGNQAGAVLAGLAVPWQEGVVISGSGTNLILTGNGLSTDSAAYVDAANPKYVVFTSGALIGQRFAIAAHAYNGSSGQHSFTIASMPTAPAGGDRARIV